MRFEVQQGTVYGEPYHYITVDWFDTHLVFDLVNWCEETFGLETPHSTWAPGKRWYLANASTIWIRDESDLTLFLLRWA